MFHVEQIKRIKDMELKLNQIELKEGRKVEGYITRFDAPYFDGSKHRPEMYVDWLKSFDEQGIRIPLLYLHSGDPQGGKPIGAMTEYKIDDIGIYAVFNLSDTPFVNDEVIPSIESGALTHFSTEETIEDERVILAVALVPIGNAINARIEAMNKAKTDNGKTERKSNILTLI